MLRYAGKVMLVVLLGGALVLAMGATAHGPRLEVQPQKLEFGTMKRGDKQRKTLTVRNAGDSQLTIEQIRPSCTECIVDQVALKPLAPGEAMNLPITFYASDVPGDHTAYVTFHSNDAEEPLKRVYLTVTIEATKLPRLTVEPAVIDLGVVLAGEPAFCTVKLANIGDAPLHVKDFTATPGVDRTGGRATQGDSPRRAPGAEAQAQPRRARHGERPRRADDRRHGQACGDRAHPGLRGPARTGRAIAWRRAGDCRGAGDGSV